MSWTAVREAYGSDSVKMTSSKNSEILWCLPWQEIPWIKGWVLIFSASGSMTKAKTNGDRGHPCLVPLVIQKFLENMPSVYTYAEGEEYSASIAFWIGPIRPNFSRTLVRYPQCTLLKAFSVSKVRSREGLQVFSAKCMRFIIFLVASFAWQPGNKPHLILADKFR